MSLEFLRKIAELNLCEECFQKYKHLLEPTIKAWRSKPLGNWSIAEQNITAMVMKLEGVFKDPKTIVVELEKEEDERYSDIVDVEAFHRIERLGLEYKMRYLKKHGILKEHSYRFLDEARRVRNKIHKDRSFSEDDRKLLDDAASLTMSLFILLFDLGREDVRPRIIAEAEETAKQLLAARETE